MFTWVRIKKNTYIVIGGITNWYNIFRGYLLVLIKMLNKSFEKNNFTFNGNLWFQLSGLVSLPARHSPQPPNILWRTPPLLFTDPLLGGAGPTSQSQAHNFSLINRCSHPPSTKLMVWGGGAYDLNEDQIRKHLVTFPVFQKEESVECIWNFNGHLDFT